MGWCGLSWRLASVAVCILGSSLLTTIFQFYYVRVFKTRYGISQEWLDGAETSLIVINLFLEPALGILQDFTCAFCRNRRRVIALGGPFLVISFLLPWFCPYDAASAPSWLIGLHLALVLFCWNFFFVLTLSAYCGLYAEVSSDPDDRMRLYALGNIGSMIGRAAVFPVEKISASLHLYGRFQLSVVVVAAAAVSCFLATGLTPNQSPPPQPYSPLPPSDTISNSEQPLGQVDEDNDDFLLPSSSDTISIYSAPRIILQIFRNRNFWVAVLSNLTGGWMRNIGFANFLAIYTSLLVPVSVLQPGTYQISLFFAACQLFPIGMAAVVSQLARRYGAQNVICTSFLLTIINSAVTLLLYPLLRHAVVIPFLFIEGLLVAVTGMYTIVIGEVVDEDKVVNHRPLPVSTLIYTLNGALSRGSIGLAPILLLAALNTGGYDFFLSFHPLPTPSPRLRLVALLTATLYPALLAALALFIFSFYRPLPSPTPTSPPSSSSSSPLPHPTASRRILPVQSDFMQSPIPSPSPITFS